MVHKSNKGHVPPMPPFPPPLFQILSMKILIMVTRSSVSERA